LPNSKLIAKKLKNTRVFNGSFEKSKANPVCPRGLKKDVLLLDARLAIITFVYMK
jgi:hypothetical protein